MPTWFEQWLPESVRARLLPLLSPGVLIGLGVFSVVTFVASLVGVPFFLSRLPADYFTQRERVELGIPEQSPGALRLFLRVLKNLLGVLLLLLGVLMLVLPGQALLTLLVGAFLVDFPGKRKFERWVIARPWVLSTINRLRKRTGQPPLEPRLSWFPPRVSLPPK